MENVNIKFLHPNAKYPKKSHESDFCYDVWAVSEKEVAPNVWYYGFGFALQYANKDVSALLSREFKLRPRSSVWKTGMVMCNSFATIDEGYTGEIGAYFYHVLPNMPRYKVGDKIAQLCCNSTDNISFIKKNHLNDTDRGANGYGSTGNN